MTPWSADRAFDRAFTGPGRYLECSAGTVCPVVLPDGTTVTGVWVRTADLVPGETFVVHGPAGGRWWKDGNQVCGVRSVEVIGDRTNTRVVLTIDDPDDPDSGSWGNWSRMTFLTVQPVPC